MDWSIFWHFEWKYKTFKISIQTIEFWDKETETEFETQREITRGFVRILIFFLGFECQHYIYQQSKEIMALVTMWKEIRELWKRKAMFDKCEKQAFELICVGLNSMTL